MSKSKGNVVNPIELADQYGADSVRFALVYGTAFGNDQALSYPKLEAARKFTNKLWNIGRFIEMKQAQNKTQNLQELKKAAVSKTDQEWVEKTEELVENVSKQIEKYQFNFAAENLYEFIWHQFADIYIEGVKDRIDDNSSLILNSLFVILLQLLHPFMPFVTEAIYQQLWPQDNSIMVSRWPDSK